MDLASHSPDVNLSYMLLLGRTGIYSSVPLHEKHTVLNAQNSNLSVCLHPRLVRSHYRRLSE